MRRLSPTSEITHYPRPWRGNGNYDVTRQIETADRTFNYSGLIRIVDGLFFSLVHGTIINIATPRQANATNR